MNTDEEIRNNRRKGSLNKNNQDKESVEYLIESPIRCGFLMSFCSRQFNSENMNFLISVIRFRDILCMDKEAWTKPWRVVDSEVENSVVNIEEGKEEIIGTKWPSSKVNKAAACEIMRQIIDDFIIEDSPFEICMSREVQRNTLRRADLVDLYGPDVFAEATIDPIKTMKKDILPRFLLSPQCLRMRKRLGDCVNLPKASELMVPPPTRRLIDGKSPRDFPDDRRFELNEFLECMILYTEFLTYLRKNVCSENLICLRMVMIFEELLEQNQLENAEEEAWTIYRYFIAPGSAYEISLAYNYRRQLCLNMAVPKRNMFDEVKKSVKGMLNRNFEHYKDTPAYESLARRLKFKMRTTSFKARKKQADESRPSSAFSCLGFS